MAMSPRILEVQRWRDRTEARRKLFGLPSKRRRSVRRRFHAGLAGRSALIELSNRREELELRALEDTHSPGPDSDLDKPWWAMVLTTMPAFIDDEERAKCEMLMALASTGAPAPNWTRIASRCEAFFALESAACKSSSGLHLDYPELCGSPFLDGRAVPFMPGFSQVENHCGLPLFMDFSVRDFDRRRSKRRSRKAPPADWNESFKDSASTIWLSGIPRSLALARTSCLENWPATLRGLAAAMLAEGAISVRRVPGFFARWPRTLDLDHPGMSEIDFGRLDPARALWTIGDQANAPSSTSARRSL